MAIMRHSEKKIRKLPRILQPTALKLRDALKFLKNKMRRETDSEVDIRKKLSLGVQYVCGTDVIGDIAEFGTMTGRTASLIAYALLKFDIFKNGPKKLHLFDSFKGLPQAESIFDKNSPHVISGIWKAGTCKGVSKEKLNCMCRKFLPESRIIIYDGWFKYTLPKISKNTKFAMIHIDCDMYQSTIELLAHMFQNKHIGDGTVIFFDDYSCNRASPDFGERKAWSEITQKFSVVFTDCGEYGCVGRKFIIHSYQAAN